MYRQVSQEPNSPMDRPGLKVGVVYWQPGDGIASLCASTFTDLGCAVTTLPYDAAIPDKLDAIFAAGPSGTLVPLGKQLLTCPPDSRPLLVLWQLEQFPNPGLPGWWWRIVGSLRSSAEQIAYRQNPDGAWRMPAWLRWTTGKAYRFRYYGDLLWLRRQRALSILAISSRWTADLLRKRGFESVAVPFGFSAQPEWGSRLALERDIPVLWLGQMGSNRRARLVNKVREGLRARGIELMVIDGVERPYVWGQERTKLLNRTKIMLNLVRAKWDDNTIRYVLAAANGAMIIAEPTLPHSPFVPGKHLVEVPAEDLVETICHYLACNTEREAVADAAYDLVTTDLRMTQVMAPVMHRMRALLERKP